MLTDLQSKPVTKAPAAVEDTTWPVGPTGSTRICIVRPQGATEALPLLMYFHGGGWVLGDTITHDRLVRELAVGVRAAVVFVDYVNSPEARYPTQNAGDSVGGNMTAAVTLMAKARGGPRASYQVLFYPLTDYISERPSYIRSTQASERVTDCKV